VAWPVSDPSRRRIRESPRPRAAAQLPANHRASVLGVKTTRWAARKRTSFGTSSAVPSGFGCTSRTVQVAPATRVFGRRSSTRFAWRERRRRWRSSLAIVRRGRVQPPLLLRGAGRRGCAGSRMRGRGQALASSVTPVEVRFDESMLPAIAPTVQKSCPLLTTRTLSCPQSAKDSTATR
jgi:hypothetical protein